LPPLLIQADIRALAGVCVTLWRIFRPLVEYKVTIELDGSLSDAVQKALAITRTSTILDSVVTVNIGKRTIWWKFRPVHKILYLFSPTLFTLVKAIPAMRQLHTVHLWGIFLARTYLCCILSSPYLTHLILDAVRMPNISKLPPAPQNLRILTICSVYSWEAIEPLIARLATSLEYLELKWCIFRSLRRFPLPSFPCLRELRHHQRPTLNHGNEDLLNELFHLVPQVTHLHLDGWVYYRHITAFPKSLQHLSIEEMMLREQRFGPITCPQLMSLSLQCYRVWGLNYHLTLSSFIRNHFPRITCLHLDRPWTLPTALALARSQHHVQTLKVSLKYTCGLDREGTDFNFPPGIPSDILRGCILPAALQSLILEVVQTNYELEQSVPTFTQWIDDNVLPPVTGLGGPDLKNIDVLFVRLESKLERERVVRRRWVKLPNDDWLMEECL